MQQQLIKLKPLISLLIATILLFVITIIIGRVLIPFISALILAYVLNPMVDKLQTKYKVNRKISALVLSLIILFIFIAIPIYLVPVLFGQFKAVLDKIPQIITLLNHSILHKFNLQLGTNWQLDLNSLKQIAMANQAKMNSLDLVQKVAQNGVILVEVIVYLVLIPFALFYSIIGWHSILKFFDEMIPRSFTHPMHVLVKDIDTMLSSYLRGQLSVMFVMACYYSIALTLVGLPSGTAIGIITGLLVFIPYLGVLSGLTFAMTIGLAQFTGSANLLAIFAAFAVGHVLEGALVTPFLVGGRIGLNPIMIILALMVFGKVFGLVGVLLALPLSTIAVVLLRHAKKYYKSTHYYKD